MKLILIFLLVPALLLLPACAQPTEAPTTTEEDEELPVVSAVIEEEETTPPAVVEEQEETPPAISQEDIAAAQEVVFRYWEAFNNYDIEGVLACLEESYRLEKEASLKSDMDRMRAFNTKLGVEEEAEPAITPEGKIEIKIKLDVPLPMPDRHVSYYLEKINGEWKIYLSVEE